MNPILKNVLARLEEPSTWAGGGVGAVLIHSALPGALGDSIIVAVAAVAAVLAIVLPEKAADAPAASLELTGGQASGRRSSSLEPNSPPPPPVKP